MGAKFVKEHLEESCDICYEYKWGMFVELELKNICEECCNTIVKSVNLYELESR